MKDKEALIFENLFRKIREGEIIIERDLGPFTDDPGLLHNHKLSVPRGLGLAPGLDPNNPASYCQVGDKIYYAIENKPGDLYTVGSTLYAYSHGVGSIHFLQDYSGRRLYATISKGRTPQISAIHVNRLRVHEVAGEITQLVNDGRRILAVVKQLSGKFCATWIETDQPIIVDSLDAKTLTWHTSDDFDQIIQASVDSSQVRLWVVDSNDYKMLEFETGINGMARLDYHTHHLPSHPQWIRWSEDEQLHTWLITAKTSGKPNICLDYRTLDDLKFFRGKKAVRKGVTLVAAAMSSLNARTLVLGYAYVIDDELRIGFRCAEEDSEHVSLGHVGEVVDFQMHGRHPLVVYRSAPEDPNQSYCHWKNQKKATGYSFIKHAGVPHPDSPFAYYATGYYLTSRKHPWWTVSWANRQFGDHDDILGIRHEKDKIIYLALDNGKVTEITLPHQIRCRS